MLKATEISRHPAFGVNKMLPLATYRVRERIEDDR